MVRFERYVEKDRPFGIDPDADAVARTKGASARDYDMDLAACPGAEQRRGRADVLDDLDDGAVRAIGASAVGFAERDVFGTNTEQTLDGASGLRSHERRAVLGEPAVGDPVHSQEVDRRLAEL
jgi:hypothetical protein